MVNLEPNSSSVGLGDLTQQFADILSGANTDRGNRNGGDSDTVHPEQTRLPSIIREGNNTNSDRGISDLSRNTQNIVFGDATGGNRDNLIGNLHQEHVNNRSNNSIPSLDVTGEPSISRHQEHILQENVHSSSRASLGLEIRVTPKLHCVIMVIIKLLENTYLA
jgi:hypothetical protein